MTNATHDPAGDALRAALAVHSKACCDIQAKGAGFDVELTAQAFYSATLFRQAVAVHNCSPKIVNDLQNQLIEMIHVSGADVHIATTRIKAAVREFSVANGETSLVSARAISMTVESVDAALSRTAAWRTVGQRAHNQSPLPPAGSGNGVVVSFAPKT